MKNLNIFDRVRNIFATKIQNNNSLNTESDPFGCTLSNETTLKLFYHANMTNSPYRRRDAFCKIVSSTNHRALIDEWFSIPWKDSPSSILRMLKNLCSNRYRWLENENLLKNIAPQRHYKCGSVPILVRAISLERLVRLNRNFQFLPNFI